MNPWLSRERGENTMRGSGRRAVAYSGALLAGLVYLAQPLRIGVIRGESMAPTLRNGQPYLLDTRAYTHAPPRRGEVVVFQEEGATCIKRVIAVEGDTLLLQQFLGEGRDELVAQEELPRFRRLLADPRKQRMVRLHALTIPRGSVYLVGDAQRTSYDSRAYGPVSVTRLLGRVPAPPAPQHGQLAARFTSHATL
jgi:signal peptidase I